MDKPYEIKRYKELWVPVEGMGLVRQNYRISMGGKRNIDPVIHRVQIMGPRVVRRYQVQDEQFVAALACMEEFKRQQTYQVPPAIEYSGIPLNEYHIHEAVDLRLVEKHTSNGEVYSGERGWLIQGSNTVLSFDTDAVPDSLKSSPVGSPVRHPGLESSGEGEEKEDGLWTVTRSPTFSKPPTPGRRGRWITGKYEPRNDALRVDVYDAYPPVEEKEEGWTGFEKAGEMD